jgi:CRP/FNR family cyclic AMP-dependent transcriptional regulator
MLKLLPELAKVDAFGNLKPDELKQLAAVAQLNTAPRGTHLLWQGETSARLLVLLSGTAKIVREGCDGTHAVLNIVGAGEVLGEINAIDHLGHSAHVITSEHCCYASLYQPDVERFMGDMPSLTSGLVQLMAKRLRNASLLQETLHYGEVIERLICIFIALANRYAGVNEKTRIYLPLRLTQGDIAELIGASRYRVNQCMNRLKEEGQISFLPQHRILVLNLLQMQERLRQTRALPRNRNN